MLSASSSCGSPVRSRSAINAPRVEVLLADRRAVAVAEERHAAEVVTVQIGHDVRAGGAHRHHLAVECVVALGVPADDLLPQALEIESCHTVDGFGDPLAVGVVGKEGWPLSGLIPSVLRQYESCPPARRAAGWPATPAPPARASPLDPNFVPPHIECLARMPAGRAKLASTNSCLGITEACAARTKQSKHLLQGVWGAAGPPSGEREGQSRLACIIRA